MGEFKILGASEFSCVTSGLLEKNNISGYYWITIVNLLAAASTVFVKYIFLVRKRLKAFLTHLCYFVRLSEE